MIAYPPRILVAGIGNIFLGDDAFGVCVVRELMRRTWPEGVRVGDFGIRGLDLVYALLDGWDIAILVDATPRGGVPGTLYTIEPELPLADDASAPELIEGHSMDPARVLRLVRSMGGRVGRFLVVGCEPTPVDPTQDMQMELSPPVQAAVEPAARLVDSLISQQLSQPIQREERYESEHAGNPAGRPG